jgi:hypothetical protein
MGESAKVLALATQYYNCARRACIDALVACSLS